MVILPIGPHPQQNKDPAMSAWKAHSGKPRFGRPFMSTRQPPGKDDAVAGSSPPRGIPRVAVVTAGVIPEQLVLWKACDNRNAAITIVGTDRNVYEGRWPWRTRKPRDLETILLRPITPTRLLARGQVWWLYRGLGEALRRIRPDLIHVCSEPWGGLVVQTLVARRLLGLSTPVCAHGAENIYGQGSPVERHLRKLILGWVLPRLNGFASWTEEGIEVARQAGLGQVVPTAVVPSVIPDPDEFSPLSPSLRRDLRASLGLPVDEPVVGFVGRLAKEKGISDLILAFRDIGHPTPFLGIWGAGELFAKVKQQLFTEKVIGRVFEPLGLHEVRKAYQACDVIVVPSRTTASWKEQFGRVALEAMLAGCVVIAYRTGALPEVLRDAGVLVEEGDIAGLRAAIRRMIDKPQERARLADKGRRSALERYHPAILSDLISSLWLEVLSPHR